MSDTDKIRVRRLKTAVDEIKRNDPGCDLTIYTVRKIITNGDIPSTRVGKNIYVDPRNILRYFSGCGEKPDGGDAPDQ